MRSAPEFSIVLYFPQQQEQDPTNLYIANLPTTYKESDVDNMLSKFGQVISTRILRDSVGVSKGVGFARMESKEKCEQIINMLNGHSLPENKEPLLVKFADGGNKKKNLYKNNDNNKGMITTMITGGDGIAAVSYDPNALAPNGVGPHQVIPGTIPNYGRHFSQVHWRLQCLIFGAGLIIFSFCLIEGAQLCSVGAAVCGYAGGGDRADRRRWL